MFERFTERARQVVVFAQDEARTLRHNYIGTEHILLGLLREEEGLAARLLESLGITVEEVRTHVARVVGEGEEVLTGQIPFTPRSKKVLELSLREAMSLGHNYIGTEHLLLGLVRENKGVAAEILLEFDADAERIRDEMLRMMSGQGEVHPPFAAESPPIPPEVAAEIDRVRNEKEEALQAQDFERAATLRDRERRLVGAARQLMRAWKDEPAAEPVMRSPTRSPVYRALPRERRPRRRAFEAQALLFGWALFAVAAGLGLLVGWLIWG